MSSAGAEAVELAASAGLFLDDWQAWWLDHALSEQADGLFCARELVLICARQSGKNAILAALELAALELLGDPLVIHSAHEVPTALNHFQFMLGLIQNTPDLDRKIDRVSYTNGKEAIEFRNGSVLQFRARGRNSGRGLTAGRLVFDEAFQIPPQSMGALIPTLRTMRNPQITYASSAPKADSVVLHSLIRRGRADDPSDRLFYAEWGNLAGTSMDDVDAWYQANPGLGIRIEEKALHDEYRTLVAGGDAYLIAEFAREAVGIGDEPISTARGAIIPADCWAKTAIRSAPVIEPGEITLAYDISKDGYGSVAIASGSISAPFVEVIEHRHGTGWIPERMVELALRWQPSAIGCNGGGPAGAQVGPIIAALATAGVDVNTFRQLTTVEYKQSCGGMLSDIVEGRLTRPADSLPLDAAAADATDRPMGDAWIWDLRQSSVPISPLVAVTVARALLPVKAEARRPVFAY